MSLSLIGCFLRSGMTSENGPTGCNHRLAENARIRLRSPPAPCDISLSFSTSSFHESSLANSLFLRDMVRKSMDCMSSFVSPWNEEAAMELHILREY